MNYILGPKTTPYLKLGVNSPLATGAINDVLANVWQYDENFSLIDTAIQELAAASGSAVSVNGSLITSPNFNSAAPEPPAGYVNVIWASSGSAVSAYAPAGFLNPMLDAGDLLYEDSSLGPARLPIGTSGEVLTVVGGLPVWAATAQSTTFEASGSVLSSDSTVNFEGDGTYITISNPSAGNVKSALNYSALITALEASLDTTFDAYGAAASALSAAESFASSAAATAQSNAESYAASAASTAQSNAETYANSVNTTGSSGSCTGNAATATSATTAANLSGSQTANYFYAAPNGSAGVGSWRAIVAADIPTLNQNTTGTAANLSGTPALPSGTTATTQTPGDSSLKLATDGFVAAAVAVETARAETEEALLASIISGLGSEFLALTGGTMSGTINMNENLIVWENSSLGIDTSLSRVGPGILGIGTGANGSSNGTLDLGALNVSGISTFGGSGTTTITTQAPGTSPATAGFDLWQNTTPTVTGAATTVALSTTTAPVSLGSNKWLYTLAAAETGAASNGWVNASVTLSGWTGSATGNNGTFVIIASTTTTITVVNATGTTVNTGTPVMISSAVVNSPILQLAGTVNTGTAGTLNSAADCWSIQNVIGSVVPNPTSTLTFTHTGSAGSAAVQVPLLTLGGVDAGVSRLGAASLAIGNGTQGDTSGKLTAGTVLAPAIEASTRLFFNSAASYTGAGINFSLPVDTVSSWSFGDSLAASIFKFQNGSAGLIMEVRADGLVDLGTAVPLTWDGGTPTVPDTGISRLGAASLAIGNGTAGDFTGSLKLSTINLQTGLTTPFTVALTAQTSSIGATNLVATPVTTSLYAVHYYLNDTTAGTSGTVSVTITWNDGASQTFTSANVTFGVLGAHVSGMVVVKATSGAIQYSTTVTSAAGSPAYSLDLRVVPLS